MDKYLVLPRKFRPQTFEEVVGQEAVVTILKNAIRHHKLSHAYIFSGMRGVGKTTLARILAKALNCQNLTEQIEPCNQCSSCREINQSHSLDVLEIDGASNRGIDDVRKINETIFYAPAHGKYKIYIIDEVHMLTKEAFNALLKTLEEPPENIKFFFATTEIHKVLPTILSRTQKLDLKNISHPKICAHLQALTEKLERKASKEALFLIAKKAEGSLRDALSLLDQLLCYTEKDIDVSCVEKVFGLIPSSLLENLDQALDQQDISSLLDLIEQIVQQGKDLSDFIDDLIEHFRGHLHKETIFSEKKLLYILEILIEGQILLQKSSSKRAIVEMLMVKILVAKHIDSLPLLAQRLLLLEKELKKPSPIQTQPQPKTPQTPPPKEKPKWENHISHYDNLMRFAEVELEGIVHKH